MLKKPLIIATVTAALAMGAVSTQASAADPLLGALIGGGIGAAIGHDVNRHNGAAVGGVLGAIVGSSIAAESNGYYDRGYNDRGYYAPAPAHYGDEYYAPAPAYYGPAYYPAPVVVYSSSPRYGYRSYGHDYRWYNAALRPGERAARPPCRRPPNIPCPRASSAGSNNLGVRARRARHRARAPPATRRDSRRAAGCDT